MKITIFALVAILMLAATLEARQFLVIDSFKDSQTTTLTLNEYSYGYRTEGYWYTIYDSSAGLPAANFKNTTFAVGNERDVIIGYLGESADGLVVAENANGAFTIGFPLAFSGSVFLQYDGYDSGNRTYPFPGAYLNAFPGLGSSAVIVDENPDGRTVDFTSADRALGLVFVARADHPVEFNLLAIDSNDIENQYTFTYTPVVEGTASNQTVFVRFDDSTWTNLATFDWTTVAAFQLSVEVRYTEQTAVDDPIDAAIYTISTFGYAITGNVVLDCDCAGTSVTDVSGQTFNLLPSTGTTVLATTTSDSNGDFTFTGFAEGTYRVCIADTTVPRCSPTASACISVTLASLTDPATVQFVINSPSTFVPPADRTVNCTQGTTQADLGSATLTPCGGSSVTITNATDSAVTGTCTRTFTRTFTNNGVSVTQTITIQDPFAPTLTTAASDQSRSCSDTATESFTVWRNRLAGATWADCTTLTFSNNGTATSGPGNCGRTTVTFTATDACGQSTSTTATYTVSDGVSPTFNPSGASATCDRVGATDFTAFNAWLSSNGGATATDNCGTPTVTNNWPVGTSPSRGCSQGNTVVFTATDSCGNTTPRTVIFTITDSAAPVITRNATQNVAISCSSDVQSTYDAYLAANGNALASDACFTDSNLSWNNNAPSTLSTACNEPLNIQFTASDPCGLTSSVTTGSVFLQDNTAPTVTTNPSPLSVTCTSGTENSQLSSWLNNAGGMVASDTCSNPITYTNNFNASAVSGSCTNVPVVFTACDACGNCVTRSTTYSIVDSTGPTFNPAPQNRSATCGGSTDLQTQFQNWLDTYGSGSVTDNCASTSQITVTNSNGNTAIGTTCNSARTVTFTARDVCGNPTAATATFSVVDNTPPTLVTSSSNPVVECNSTSVSSFSTWRSNRGGFTATDSCGTVSYTTPEGATSIALPTTGCSSSATVTFIATDGCGNNLRETATYTIQDTVAPRITTAASNATAQCGASGITAWLSNNGGARATDDCSTATFTNDFTALDGGCTASARVTFTATDACGLFTRTTATYSVVDTAAPVINPRASAKSVPCNNDTRTELLAWVADNGGARATDACQDNSTLVWSSSFANNALSCGSLTLTFTVRDPCGNNATTTATFTSTDTAGPSFTTPAQNLTVQCDGSGNTADYAGYIASQAGAVAFDVCSLSSLNYTVTAPSAGPTTCGTQVVTVSAADQCGNSARSTAYYTVIDNQAPQFNNFATDSLVECDGSGNTAARTAWLANNGGATATDVCASTVNIVSRQLTTDGTCNRATTYVFTASDACGNSVNTTARFIIQDTTAPQFTTDPSPASYQCDGAGNTAQIAAYLSNNGGARVSDACTSNVTVSNDFGSQQLLTCTTALVNFIATDSCGNVASRSSQITIIDDVDPVWTTFPEDYVLPCDADTSEEVLGTALASDVCASGLNVDMREVSTQDPPNGDCPGSIFITRTYSVSDACGNSITRDQTITVLGQRSSGPCEPEGCECDGCCPQPAASDCLPVDCEAVACSSAPCEAVQCSCSSSKAATHTTAARDLDDLPQCKPVYIYVNDDDDDSAEIDAAQRTLVSNKPLNLL